MTFSELIHQNKPVLIDFYADWCRPCKMMAPILEDVKSELGEKITVVKINVDKNSAAATKFQVRGVPTLILLQSGKLLYRQSGVVGKEDLLGIINSRSEKEKV